MEPHKIGDKVVATFPNSCLSLGGTVAMVVAVNGKPISYTVIDLGGFGNAFDEETVKQA